MPEGLPAVRRRIAIFDATLRDGEQAPGNAMSPQAKLEYALRSEAFGSDVIEVGFPGSSPADFEATRIISAALTTARFSTFNRCSREDITASAEAGGISDRHQIAICGTGSDLHLKYKRGITRAQSLVEGRDAVAFARSLGATDVAFCVEDASRGDRDYIRALTIEAVEAGARTIGMADTTGCASPQEYGDLFAAAREWLPADVVLSTHCHDDLGLSLANALAGVQAGAGEVQATMSGIGERSGNTALEEIVAVLSYKGEALGMDTSIQLEGLMPAYEVLAELIDLPPSRNKAILGINSFATQAGIHQDGILKNPKTYEFLDPHRFGRQRKLLVGRHSGRAVLRYLLQQLGVAPDERIVAELYETFIASRTTSDCDELEDLKAALGPHLTGASLVTAS